MYPTGAPRWEARFTPREPGAYQAIAKLKDRTGLSNSKPITFNCVPSDSKGFIRIARKDPRFLEFSEGQPFFPIGQNLAFIGDQQFVSVTRAEQIFAQLATNGANYLRIWTCCEDWAMAVEARKSAWGRSWDWRPPFATIPGENSTRQYLKLSSQKPTLNINPSHNVALRPQTRYVLTGKVITEPEVTLRVSAQGTKSTTGFTSKQNTWLPFRLEFQTGPNDYWLQGASLQVEGSGNAWVDALSLAEATGGPELLWEAQVNRPTRGYYNPLDCFMLDQVVTAAGKNGIYLQLCLLTRDLYMKHLKDPASAEYAQAIADAKKFLRYAIARWGYSTSVAAWEYWNEMDPGMPTARFYSELGDYLQKSDPYQHLRTTSTWGPSARDCQHASLDFADTHFYLRPTDKARLRDEVDAVLDRSRWLRQQATNKPAHLGEFGLANDKWQPTEEMNRSRELVDFHNGLWASALSGTTGTGLFWWWERLHKLNAYPIYRPLSTFISDIPWNSGEVQPLTVQTNQSFRIIGLKSRQAAWLWVFDPAAAWAHVVIEQKAPPERTGVELQIDWPAETGKAQWWDTRSGTILREDIVRASNGSLKLIGPEIQPRHRLQGHPQLA